MPKEIGEWIVEVDGSGNHIDSGFSAKGVILDETIQEQI